VRGSLRLEETLGKVHNPNLTEDSFFIAQGTSFNKKETSTIPNEITKQIRTNLWTFLFILVKI
jgi:hypothetical protein